MLAQTFGPPSSQSNDAGPSSGPAHAPGVSQTSTGGNFKVTPRPLKRARVPDSDEENDPYEDHHRAPSATPVAASATPAAASATRAAASAKKRRTQTEEELHSPPATQSRAARSPSQTQMTVLYERGNSPVSTQYIDELMQLAIDDRKAALADEEEEDQDEGEDELDEHEAPNAQSAARNAATRAQEYGRDDWESSTSSGSEDSDSD